VKHLTACPVASREFHARHRVAQCPGLPRSNSARLEKVNGSYVTDDLRSREDDVIWRAALDRTLPA
jgi:predicted thioesterase